MIKQEVDILCITISKPILIGIYKDSTLIDTISKDDKTSDLLPCVFTDILNNYTIKSIYYVNGPGSFMAIKISYIFLQTICIVNGIKLKATNGFCFNNNTPIKALGNKYFYKNDDEDIYVDLLDDNKLEPFKLPKILDDSIFANDCLPTYNLPAVY